MKANVDLTNIVLETDRLILRAWKETDLTDFYEYAKVDGVGQMAGWSPHTSIQESKIILDMFMKEKNVFALELKNNHKVIGSLGLEKISLKKSSFFLDHVNPFCMVFYIQPVSDILSVSVYRKILALQSVIDDQWN